MSSVAPLPARWRPDLAEASVEFSLAFVLLARVAEVGGGRPQSVAMVSETVSLVLRRDLFSCTSLTRLGPAMRLHRPLVARSRTTRRTASARWLRAAAAEGGLWPSCARRPDQGWGDLHRGLVLVRHMPGNPPPR